MKATEQYFPVVLFIMLHNVVVTFESEDEFLKFDHLSECLPAKLSCVPFLFKKKIKFEIYDFPKSRRV